MFERAEAQSVVEKPGFDRRAFLQRTALTGLGGRLGRARMLAACGSSASSRQQRGGSASVFGSHPTYKFVFVNHVTTNPFFVPTQYGAADACKLLGCTYQWTGSESSNVNQMVNAMNTAITERRRRHRGRADRPARVQRARRSRAEGGHPGRRLQRRRARATSACPTSART